MTSKASAPAVAVSGSDSNGKAYANVSELWQEELGGAQQLEYSFQNLFARRRCSCVCCFIVLRRRQARQRQLVPNWRAVLGGALSCPNLSSNNNSLQNIEGTDDGVLGGYGHISPIGARHNAYKKLQQSRVERCRCERLEEVSRHDWRRQRQRGWCVRGKLLSRLIALAPDCGAGIGRVTKDLLLPYFKAVDLVVRSVELSSREKSRFSFVVFRSKIPSLWKLQSRTSPTSGPALLILVDSAHLRCRAG